MNKHQLMFGECTDGTKIQPDPVPGKLIFYSSELSRVAAERCTIEMALSPEGTGGLWVAQKVPDGEVFVAANELRIREIDPDDPDMLYQ